MMTREKARDYLTHDVPLNGGAWTWTEYTRSCWDDSNCCFETFNNVEETLDNIELYCVGYTEVEPQ